MKFVHEIAKYIKDNELPLANLKIILPSERMKKYLHAALFEAYGKPILAPQIITIDRWVKELSSQTVVDKTRVLLELFKIQLKHAKSEEDRSFDEFLTWGEIILSDYSEIDRGLLDAKQVFKNLADIKEIENWSFDREELSPAQIRFMEFWDRLPVYYYDLQKALKGKNITYSAGAYKELAENIDRVFTNNKDAIFLFAGFNALSPAEMAIIKQLMRYGRGHFLISADSYYLDNPRHEAGLFIRQVQKELDLNDFQFVSNKLAQKALAINLIDCAQITGQVKVMSSLLSKLSVNELNETLLLLADESLINSVVRNLPASIEKANITLGMPIKNTSVRQWVELVFSIQENKTRFKTNAVYYADLQKFWSHPFVLALLDDNERRLINETENNIVRNNRIFINAQNLEVGETTKSITTKLIQPWNGDWTSGVSMIRELNRMIYAKLRQEHAFEKAILECFDHGLQDFENLLNEGIPEMSFRAFRHLFNQSWTGRSIAYHGNPIDGLQIMGMLETRGLDFKRIICLGMNDGNLPPTNPIQTMIPMDLRRYLGLPTPREKQGIFAHHFYRLLHQVEHLDITYCSADETIGFSEPSRYLLQIEKELSRVNRGVIIKKQTYALELIQKKMQLSIPKTTEIKNRLDELFANSSSASMLKKYTTCPLDFYFRYVMEFGEEQSVEEEVEHSTFGSFIHKTLERLYTPFARLDEDGQVKSPSPPNITSMDVRKMLKEFEVILQDEFLKHFNNDKEAFSKGKNYLSFEMAKDLTSRFLKAEVAFLEQQTEPVFIEALEQKFEQKIEIEIGGVKKVVNLVGYVDRIDRVGNQIRIIDYKSGKVDEKDVVIGGNGTEDELILKSIREKKHVLQLMQYAFMYFKSHGVVPSCNIISFISNKHEPFELNSTKLEIAEVAKNYPAYLSQIISEIYDEEIPFEHNTLQWKSYCMYC